MSLLSPALLRARLGRALFLLLSFCALSAQAMDKTIVVLQLDVHKTRGKMDDTDRSSVEDMIRDEAINALGGTGWTVLSGETTMQLLKDNGVDPSKCDDSGCHLTLARGMTVPMFISGSIEYVEGTFTASIRLVDTKTGQILAATNFESPKILGLRSEFRRAAPAFFAKAGLAAGDLPVSSAPSGGSVPTPGTPSGPGRGALKIVSSPSGAKVSIDGDPVGATPLALKRDAGTYVVTIESPGYAPVSRTVEVTGGRAAVVNETLMQAAGYLQISISPDAAARGASVTVDDKPAGPGKQGPYRVGTHLVRAESAGYRGAEQKVSVDNGGTADVQLVLEALPGKLLLSVNVAASCSAGAAKVQATPDSMAKLEVPAGSAHVVCTAEGHDDASADAEVAPGKAGTVTLSLKRYSGPKPGQTRVEPKSGLEFVPLPAGSFHLGCEPQDTQCYDNEKPGRSASVGALWLGKTDVTVAAWKRCVAADACENIANDDDQHRCNLKNGRDDHPMNCVDWTQAKAFCSWIGGRLPTAEEWEYAAKSGESRVFPWGDAPIDASRANVCDKRCHEANPSFTNFDASFDDGFAATSPVGAFPRGASKWGLMDMAGNVWQWTSSDYDASNKELRGGGWVILPRYARASSRLWNAPSDRYTDVGLRCGL